MKDLRFACIFALALALVSTLHAAAPEPLGQFAFKRDGELMLVEVLINDSAPAVFVVDSGAPHTVLDPKFVRELGLKTQPVASVTGTGAGAVENSKTTPGIMKIGELKINLPEPWVIDLSKVPIPSNAKGLVGAEIFRKYVVRINPLESTFTVFDPATFQYTGNGASVPLIVERDKLFLEAELEVPAGKISKHKLRIDTGSESSVNDEIVKESAEVRSSTLGGGLGEDFKSYSGVFTSVKIGPHAIKHVWGPGGPGPAIGMEILRRFVLTFDASRGQLYLEPTAAFAEPVPTPPE
jgi:hypothetical protein